MKKTLKSRRLQFRSEIVRDLATLQRVSGGRPSTLGCDPSRCTKASGCQPASDMDCTVSVLTGC